GVELGEERLARRLDGRARGAESLPQLVAVLLRDTRTAVLRGLPAGEQRVELRGHLLPLSLGEILCRERFRFGDDALAFDHGIRDGLLRLGALLLGGLAEGLLQLGEPVAQALQVADGVRRGDGGGERRDGLGDILSGSAASQTLLEKRDLPLELRELALVVGKRLLGRRIRILAHGALARRLADVHRAVVVDATPRCLLVRCLLGGCLLVGCLLLGGRLLVAHWSPAFASIVAGCLLPTRASLLQGHPRDGGG